METKSPTVSISPNPTREKVLVDSSGRIVPMKNGLRQAQAELKKQPIKKDE